MALDRQNYSMARKLVENGIDANHCAAEIIRTLSHRNDLDWFGRLLESGMKTDSVNYSAMDACIKAGGFEQAVLLIEHGMDFEKYTEWANHFGQADKSGEVFRAVKEHWEQAHTQAPAEPSMGGMT